MAAASGRASMTPMLNCVAQADSVRSALRPRPWQRCHEGIAHTPRHLLLMKTAPLCRPCTHWRRALGPRAPVDKRPSTPRSWHPCLGGQNDRRHTIHRTARWGSESVRIGRQHMDRHNWATWNLRRRIAPWRSSGSESHHQGCICPSGSDCIAPRQGFAQIAPQRTVRSSRHRCARVHTPPCTASTGSSGHQKTCLRDKGRTLPLLRAMRRYLRRSDCSLWGPLPDHFRAA